MIKFKQRIICILTVLSLIICSVVLLVNSPEHTYAETSDEPINLYQLYTDSDIIYGQSDPTKTIQWFSQNYEDNNGVLQYITMIIPQYCFDNQGKYHYMGEAYGFYVDSSVSSWKILIIDIDVKNSDTDATVSDLETWYTMRILTQFRMTKTSGLYLLPQDYSTFFTLRNTKFLSTVYNENAYNYGDSNYLKSQDNGVIFLQTRMNYKLAYMDQGLHWEYLGAIAMDWASYCIGKYLPIWEDLIQGIDLIGDTINNIVEFFRIQTVEANNELNISTSSSKSQQANNGLDFYSKSVHLFSERETAIGIETDDYVQYITVVNDSNQKSRFVSAIQFEIYEGSSKIQTGNGYFGFVHTLTRYTQSLTAPVDGGRYYVLYNGSHDFRFAPTYTGIYCFNSNDSSVKIYINGVDKGTSTEINLNKNSMYTISFKSTGKVSKAYSMYIKDYTSGSKIISANNNYIMRYIPPSSNMYHFSYTNQYIVCDILNQNSA